MAEKKPLVIYDGKIKELQTGDTINIGLLGVSWRIGAGRSGNLNTNSDLRREDGIPTNVSPFIVPVDCFLFAISASALQGTNENWTAAVLVNDTQIATLAIANTDKAFRNDLNIALTAGDEVRLRFLVGDTGNVNSPTISAYLKT